MSKRRKKQHTSTEPGAAREYIELLWNLPSETQQCPYKYIKPRLLRRRFLVNERTRPWFQALVDVPYPIPTVPFPPPMRDVQTGDLYLDFQERMTKAERIQLVMTQLIAPYKETYARVTILGKAEYHNPNHTSLDVYRSRGLPEAMSREEFDSYKNDEKYLRELVTYYLGDKQLYDDLVTVVDGQDDYARMPALLLEEKVCWYNPDR